MSKAKKKRADQMTVSELAEKTNQTNADHRDVERKKFLSYLAERMHAHNMDTVGNVHDEQGLQTMSGGVVDAAVEAHKKDRTAYKPKAGTLWPYVYSQEWDFAAKSVSGNYKMYSFRKGNMHFLAFYYLRHHETFQFRIWMRGAGSYEYGDSRMKGDKFKIVDKETVVKDLARIMFRVNVKEPLDLVSAQEHLDRIELALFL